MASRKETLVIADGRLVAYPGAEVVIATELAGKIIRLPVQELSVVHRGDLLVELQSDDLRESRDEAQVGGSTKRMPIFASSIRTSNVPNSSWHDAPPA